MENTKVYESDIGTPQGGLVSPVLANVYLHYVLDLWFEKRIKEQYKGEAYIVRYADDFICMFQYEKEAKKFYLDLVERLKKFGLAIEEDKTDIMPFGRFARDNHKEVKSFDFLGFRFINGKTRTNKYRVMVRTSKKKLKEKKQVANEWFRSRRHEDVLETINKLNRKLIGHYRYYGVNGNFRSLMGFYKFIVVKLYKTLIHRSQRKYLTWERYWKLLKKHPIITPKIYINIW